MNPLTDTLPEIRTAYDEALARAKEEARDAAERRLTTAFERGTLSYAEYRKLPRDVKQFYVRLHGKAPVSAEALREQKKRTDRARKRRRLEKAGRKSARGG